MGLFTLIIAKVKLLLERKQLGNSIDVSKTMLKKFSQVFRREKLVSLILLPIK
jgi:di/tricarboxylate transporter